MASIYKRGRDKKRKGSSWYIGYVDEHGRQKTVKGCSDKAATEAMARQLESEAALRRSGAIDPREESYRRQDARPLTDHLNDWHGSILAKGRTAKHADLYLSRASQVVTKAKAKRLSDLQPSAIQSALGALREEGLSLGTCNHYRAAMRAFTVWARADRRLRDNPMDGVSGFNAEEEQRHTRRSLTEQESGQLIAAALAGPVRYRATGELRALAYRTLPRRASGSTRCDRSHPRASSLTANIP